MVRLLKNKFNKIWLLRVQLDNTRKKIMLVIYKQVWAWTWEDDRSS